MTTEIWIDYSHWETERGDTKAHVPFDWSAFRAAGGTGGTLRSCYMQTPLFSTRKMVNDALYLANVIDAQYANAKPVSYALFEMIAGTGQMQADFYLNNTEFFGLPALGDFELEGSAPLTDVRRWLEYVETKTNKIPWFYSSPGWIKKHCTVADTWLRRYPLLMANYDAAAPLVTGPFLPSDVFGWQVSQRYHAPSWGVVNGNKQCALYEMYFKDNIIPTPPPPVAQWPVPNTITVTEMSADGTVKGTWTK